jgi:nicotinate-nucleotide--dimethylbenzimidazole phosphoribosyltransferase
MPPFADTASFRKLLAESPPPDGEARARAAARDATLTKPPGALGRLEDIAIWYAGWRPGRRAERVQVAVFAGHHGVTARGVSAFPKAVTAQMVENFRRGGAAINQLAALLGATVSVIEPAGDRPTADFTAGPAMDDATLTACLCVGWAAVDPQADLLIPGEMGIGNTTAAAALAAALFGGTGKDWIGRGTGVDDAGLARKAATVDAGLVRHAVAFDDPLAVLRCLGGHEIAAMAGAMAAARHHRVPVIVDGFIATAAASVLHRLAPDALDHALAGHRSAECAHGRMLEAIGLSPLLDLGMRLGEGSGAAMAALVLRAALACHHGMATFAEAGVSEG